MFTIKRATVKDIPTIRQMASVVFPATYKEILPQFGIRNSL
mgnify:CR=1 FL=1